MPKKYKVGDRVLIGPDGIAGVPNAAGKVGEIATNAGCYYLVFFAPTLKNARGDDPFDMVDGKPVWYVHEAEIDGLAPQPARSNNRASYPINQKILKHLQTKGSISPMEALVVHGCFRLAAAIKDLRNAGHNISTTMHTDASGKNYARYALKQAA